MEQPGESVGEARTLAPPSGPRPPSGDPITPSGRPRNAVIVAGVLGVLTLLACYSFVTIAAPVLITSGFLGSSPAVIRTTVPDEVAWAGGGDFAVIQSCDDLGRSRIVVWERGTGKRRSLDGYRLIATEEVTAAAWVARDPRASNYEDYDPFVHQTASGTYDGPADGLARVLLAEEDLRPRPDAREWAHWPSGTGHVAVFGVRHSNDGDIVERAFPGTLAIGSASEAARPVELAPVTSFRPLGWSPSGRYFALLSLTSAEGQEWPAVVLIDAVTRQRVIEAMADERLVTHVGLKLAWDESEDRLWWFESTLGDDEAGEGSLRWMDMDGIGESVRAPGRVRDDGDVAGTSADGVVFVAGEGAKRSWLVDERHGRPLATREGADAGRVGAPESTLSGKGDLAYSVVRSQRGGGFVREVYVSDTDFGHERIIWSRRVPNPIWRVLGFSHPFGS